jgi:hypothetical protein
VSKPHLVEEEAARQPVGRGCVAHSWWRRRTHASEVGPTTPEEGGRLLDRTQPYCQIWPRGGYHCQEEEIATNLYRAHTPRIDALDPATGSHLEEEATSSPRRASSPSLDPDAMLRPHGKRGRTREENVTALPMPPSGRSRQRRGKTRAPAVELKSRYDAVYGEKRSTTSSFFTTTSYFVTEKRSVAIWAYLPHPMEWQAQIYLHVKRAQISTIFQVCQIIVNFFFKISLFSKCIK